MASASVKPQLVSASRSAPVSREVSYLSQKETTFLSHRSPTFIHLRGIKAAEEGRKRATVLPPLDGDSKFGNTPRRYISLEDVSDSHWQKSFKKVSLEVDRKIVTHLRKKLNRRLEKRYQTFEDERSSVENETKQQHGGRGTGHTKPNVDDSRDIFSKYSDTGDRIPRSSSRSPLDAIRKSPVQSEQESVEHGSSTTDGESSSEHVFNRKTPLPEIQPTDASPGETSDVALMADENRHEANEDEKENSVVFDNIEESGARNEETPVEENIREDFRNLDTSPVQTPVVFRPLTREQTRLTLEDRRSRILQGQVHRFCPADNKIIRIYVCSGFTDTEAERTVLIEKVFPDLKAFCAEKGRELQVFDLHWGFKDNVLDDHQLADVCVKIIDQCLDSTHGVSMLPIMSEKYGSSVLPTRIPVEEFDLLMSCSTNRRQRELDHINAQMAEIEQARALREQEKKDREITETTEDDISKRSESIATDTTVTEVSIKNPNFPISKLRGKVDAVRNENIVIRALKEKQEALPEPSLLTDWYKMDENSVPPVYRLQNISTVYKEVLRSDAKKREAAKAAWQIIEHKLVTLLQAIARLVIKDPFALRKYYMSLLEIELENGVFETDRSNHCLVVKRILTDIQDNVDDEKIRDFIDIAPGTARKIHKTSFDRMQNIRDNALPKKLSLGSMLPYELQWAPGGVYIGGDRTHQTYLERMAKQVRETLKFRLEEAFEEDKRTRDEKTILFEEVSQHVSYCLERAKHFHGRKPLLQLIKAYLRSDCQSPLVVHGKTGCGKTALIAKAAKEIHKWFKGINVGVMVRMLGITMDSTNIRTLLRGLCLQLCEVFGSNTQDVPSDYTGLMNVFAQRLSEATEEQPLVILLDSLDQLSDDHDGRKLTWMPRILPDHVHIIISTLPDEKYETFGNLKKLFGDSGNIFLEVPELPQDDALRILEHWLDRSNRSLTHEQYDLVVDAFIKCPVPLFLKIAFDEAKSWPSYMPLEQTKLAENVKKFATLKYGKLETKHGEPLVRRALGYISASRSGVTGSEMEDILSLDEAVMDDINATYHPPRRRFPTLLWIRLRNDLSDYVTEISADNMKTIRWSHAQFFEAAEDRYLNQKDKAPSYHKALAEYFMGKWSDKPKPYSGNDNGVKRFVTPQPLFYEPADSEHDGSDRIYNLRKINELPHHLLRSQQMELFKSETVCNFEWTLAKLCGTSLRALIEEYQLALQIEPTDIDLKTLSDALQLSGKALMKDPRQLASQMVGRLSTLIAKDIPATAGDPPRYPFLHAFFSQAKVPSIPSMIPSIGCLTEPGGILFDLLSGHSEPITAVALTTDGTRSITASVDNTMKVWDIRSGKVVKTIDGVGTGVSKIQTGSNNKLIITVEGSVVRIWNMKTGVCMFCIDQYDDPPVITVAGEGRILVAIFDGINIMRSWDLEKNFAKLCEASIEDNSVFKDKSVLVAPNSYGDHVLHAFRGANLATVQHARSGKVIAILQCFEKSSSVVAAGITRDYFVLACRQQYMHLSEIHQLELFDAKKGKYLRSVRGCVHDRISEMFINMMGSHAICICASEQTNTSNIAIWNLETEDHKHLARHSGVSIIGACLDFRYCLTAGKTDNTLRIWNLSGKVNQAMPKLKKALGVGHILPMVDNPRYVVARQMGNGPISIWNVAKAKCLQSAVRIERGLTDPSDIVILRNTRVIILSDRGFSSASHDSRPVFQTVFIYDLRQKKYLRKLTGCYITPSPQHEYVLLDDDNLMGPSDNRNHFVIWSLVTGHVVHRIKIHFKTSEITRHDKEKEIPIILRGSTAKMTPWERRAETHTAKQKRREKDRDMERKRREDLKKEKENAIEQFIVSGDQKIIIASYFAHHFCVFDIPSQTHTQTLENEHSLMFLHVSALAYDGSHLVHTNYDEESKTSYVTLWDCMTGQVKKRLRNETNVVALGMTDDSARVVIGKGNNEIRIWDPMVTNSLRKIKGYPGLEFCANSKIFIVDEGKKAVVYAGDISLWDIEKGNVLAVYTPDMRITCVQVAMNGKLIAFGIHETSDLIILKLQSKDLPPIVDTEGEDMFGETTGDTSDEDEDD